MRTLRTSFGSCSTQWPFVSLVGIPATAYMHFVRPNATVFIAANSPTTRRYVATHKSSFASGVRGNPDFPHRYCIVGGIGLPDPVWLRGWCRDSSRVPSIESSALHRVCNSGLRYTSCSVLTRSYFRNVLLCVHCAPNELQLPIDCYISSYGSTFFS